MTWQYVAGQGISTCLPTIGNVSSVAAGLLLEGLGVYSFFSSFLLFLPEARVCSLGILVGWLEILPAYLPREASCTGSGGGRQWWETVTSIPANSCSIYHLGLPPLKQVGHFVDFAFLPKVLSPPTTAHLG